MRRVHQVYEVFNLPSKITPSNREVIHVIKRIRQRPIDAGNQS